MREKWPIIVLGIIAVVVIVAIIISIIYASNNNQTTTLTPTISPTINVPHDINPTQAVVIKKLLDNVEHRQPLSTSDNQIRQSIIANTTPSHDIVYQTNDFVIEYVQAPNDFETEILSTDTDTAKQEAVSWFISKGISNQGICRLPLNFYLSQQVSAQLPKGYVFDRLPKGC